MALETGDFIDDLNENNPTNQDPKSQGAGHLRLIKKVLRASFTAITGAVTATHTQINRLGSLTGLSVLGRSADSTGGTDAITAGTDGHVLRRSGDTIGFGTVATAGLADGAVTTAKIGNSQVTEAKVANDAITNGKLRNSAGLSVIGRSASSSGDPADIAAASDHQVLRRSGSAVAFGAINLASSAAVTGKLPIGNHADVALRNVTSGQSSGSVTVSTSTPSGGSNGDIWLQREA